MTTALYLGRFQPFHLGHLSVVKSISKKYDKIVIAICSAQHSYTKRNPFTYGERLDMIGDTLKVENISNYRIIPIPDIDCPERWAKFCHAIFGDYDVVITNNSNTKKLFENRGDKVKSIKPHRVHCERLDESLDGLYEVSGTLVREWLSTHDAFGDLVPLKVYLFLCKNGMFNRIKKIT